MEEHSRLVRFCICAEAEENESGFESWEKEKFGFIGRHRGNSHKISDC